MTEFQLNDQVRIHTLAGRPVGVVFSVKRAPSSYRIGCPDGRTLWADECELTLVSRPSQAQRLEPMTRGKCVGGVYWFQGRYLDPEAMRPVMIEEDDQTVTPYRLVDSEEPSMEPSVAQCTRALSDVLQVEIERNDREATRLRALRDDIRNYAEL